MEKRVLIAALICAIFLSLYSQTVLKRLPSRGSMGPQAAHAPAPAATAETASLDRQPLLDPSEDTVHLVSSELDLEVGTRTGAIRRVILKKFLDTNGEAPIRFGNGAPILLPSLGAGPSGFQLVNATNDRVELRTAGQNGKDYHLSYYIDYDNPLLHIMLTSMDANNSTSEQFSVFAGWNKGDKLSDRHNQLEAQLVTTVAGDGKTKHEKQVGPFKSKRIVPRGTIQFSLADRHFCFSIQSAGQPFSITLIPSEHDTIAVEANTLLGTGSQAKPFTLTAYFGPRGHLYLDKYGFENAFPIGLLGHIGLGLLGVLSWLAGIFHNYGIAIILLSLLVTCVTAPFTLLSFKSMKKMQELKPQMDKITAQHKEDPQQANKEIFELYKKHRVSPLSGCLPMLLQMPIFLALFQAISNDIELRRKSFLWIADLSLPDRLAKLPITLPLIGSDINALPVIMAAAMFFQTRMSQQSMPVDKTNPAASIMSGPFMSILFGVMFYQFPAGLVLYWLTNSLMSIVWYRLAK